MIRLEGAELPLGALIKKSGVEEIEKPKYYQGLSIGGQKMKKWAQKHADRNAHGFSTAEKVSPLLNSAYLGSLHSTEWFLGDTPSRLYREFGSNNNSHPLVKTLANASGGFSQAVEAWLYQRSTSLRFNLNSYG